MTFLYDEGIIVIVVIVLIGWFGWTENGIACYATWSYNSRFIFVKKIGEGIEGILLTIISVIYLSVSLYEMGSVVAVIVW